MQETTIWGTLNENTQSEKADASLRSIQHFYTYKEFYFTESDVCMSFFMWLKDIKQYPANHFHTSDIEYPQKALTNNRRFKTKHVNMLKHLVAKKIIQRWCEVDWKIQRRREDSQLKNPTPPRRQLHRYSQSTKACSRLCLDSAVGVEHVSRRNEIWASVSRKLSERPILNVKIVLKCTFF